VWLLWFSGSEAEGDLAGQALAASSPSSMHSDKRLVPPPLTATTEDVPGECKRKPTGRYGLAAHHAN
jgi:hypothetical protein